MGIRQDMLRAARKARDLWPEQAGRALDFLGNQINDDGGFRDRSGGSDLYYTVFGLGGLVALGEPPPQSVERFLSKFGDGASLDLVHLACLGRCWASLGPAGLAGLADGAAERIIRRIEDCRSPDGGYSQAGGAGSAYGCFLALGAYQDLDMDLPRPEAMVQCLRGLSTGDGGYSNDAALPVGSTPATAAAVTALCELGARPGDESAAWLLERRDDEGGFVAAPGVPLADLLSTATALHALAAMGAGPAAAGERCNRFVLGLQEQSGGFRGSSLDDQADCEYTFYALLALGRLGPRA